MTRNVRQAVAMILAGAGGLAVCWFILWVFDLQIDPQAFRRFPDGWRIMDLVTHAFAVLLLFGAVRAIYGVLRETWVDRSGPGDDGVSS